MKRCKGCNVEKPIDNFYKGQTYCKACKRVIDSNWHKAKQEKKKQDLQ